MILVMKFFFFKQKTAYEISVRDWSSDVCSSDLAGPAGPAAHPGRCQTEGTHLLPGADADDRSVRADGFSDAGRGPGRRLRTAAVADHRGHTIAQPDRDLQCAIVSVRGVR